VAETWNGATWTLLPSPPLPPNHSVWFAAVFRGVSCVSSTACVAVGTYFGQVTTRSLAEAWNGTTWTVQPTPNRVPDSLGNDAGLQGVSCTTSTSCTAVGATQGSWNPLAEGWDGSSWHLEYTPWFGLMTGVSCKAAACTAVTSPPPAATSAPVAQREIGLSS
jgi:hypothetical protein